MSEQEVRKPSIRTSRIGKNPVSIPSGVTITVSGRTVAVKGSKGALEWELPADMSVEIKDAKLIVSSHAIGRSGARMQGLTRALIANMVRGTHEGFTRTLELVGTGYRAEVKNNAIQMAVGFSHPVVFPIPAGISAVVPPDSKGTQIVITGADRGLVGQIAAQLRSIRPPEPYGGKGVRYRGEQVREKAGKSGGKGAKGSK